MMIKVENNSIFRFPKADSRLHWGLCGFLFLSFGWLTACYFDESSLTSLLTFESVEDAQKAKLALNGADIYSGCCTLKIEYARVNTHTHFNKHTLRCMHTNASSFSCPRTHTHPEVLCSVAPCSPTDWTSSAMTTPAGITANPFSCTEVGLHLQAWPTHKHKVDMHTLTHALTPAQGFLWWKNFKCFILSEAAFIYSIKQNYQWDWVHHWTQNRIKVPHILGRTVYSAWTPSILSAHWSPNKFFNFLQFHLWQQWWGGRDNLQVSFQTMK